MEESSNSGVVDFPDNFMDQLLREECWEEEEEEEQKEEASLWSSLGLKERVTCAMGHLQEVMGGEMELLIQLWMPVERGRRRLLSTEGQPYSLNPFSHSHSHLAQYRAISAGYSFAAEAGSDQLVGLPDRVFLKRMPEWTPDVRFFRSEEYPRIGYARSYQVRTSLALPLFQGTSENCLAVIEMVTTHQSLEYASQLQTICHTLQAFDLRSSQTSIVPTSLKPHTDDLHREVASILQGICSSYRLPLAITWSHQQDLCLSALVSACYAADQDSRCFLAACSDHHLLAGEGIAGPALATKKQCFATDVAILSKWSYPLSHYARMFDLHAALAVPLLTRSDRTAQFVLEFFFPRDCLDTHTQRLIQDSVASQLSLRFLSSPHLMVDDQRAEEVRDAPTALTTDHSSRSAEHLVAENSPWKSRMSPEDKGKQVNVFWEYQRDDLKLGAGVREPTFSFSSSSSSSSLENRKRKTKAEKDITMDILRQHFAGSLKDAAKNIGVCPTTLKRICRQHGISRWPSRKIKKVGHSLRKLQVVMDSVEGVQGSVHLASFYSSFSQLQSSSSSSFPLLNPTKTVHMPPKSPPSSSGSQNSSGSSTCCSSEDQQLGGFQKPALSHPQLLTQSSLQEEQRPVRVTSSLPPLPSATAPRKSKDGMKVKAMFGDSKMRMSLQPHWRLTDLRREIAKRFGMDDVLTSNFSLKYLDDDQEWVLLTCDADLEECIQVYKSTLKETVRMLVHQPLSSIL